MKRIISNIKNFFIKLKRSCKWFRRMWNNHDYDSAYLIQVIVWKMKDMLYQLDILDSDIVDLRYQELYKNNGYNGDMLKSLEECIEIGERLLKDDYENYPDVVDEWFANHGFAEKMPDDIHKLFIEASHEAEVKRSDDNEKFFAIMKKHHFGWWS